MHKSAILRQNELVKKIRGSDVVSCKNLLHRMNKDLTLEGEDISSHLDRAITELVAIIATAYTDLSDFLQWFAMIIYFCFLHHDHWA